MDPCFSRSPRLATGLPIEVLGRRSDVPEILSQADVFLFTSLEEGEGMPGVLIEAGFAGLPVVTTEVPGARTVIEDGVDRFRRRGRRPGRVRRRRPQTGRRPGAAPSDG